MTITYNSSQTCYDKAFLSKICYDTDLLQKGDNAFSNIPYLTNAQKDYFNTTYELISVQKDTGTGFEAAIFKNKITNEYTMAIAGTDKNELPDLTNNTTIGTRGIAVEQFISAYNYYQKSITTTGKVKQIQVTISSIPIEGSYSKVFLDTDGSIKYISYTNVLIDNDLPESEKIDSSINFTGHSLGGHLAGLIGMATGKEATIFNAPGYKEIDSDYAKVVGFSDDGTPIFQEISTDIDLFVHLLGGGNVSGNNIQHIYNAQGHEIIANWGIDWTNSIPIYCLQEGSSVHGIDEICTAYYAYETIKDIANGAESFHNDSTITSFNETFENVYKAYCLNKGESYQELDYSEYTNINQIISKINEWSETQKANGGVIKVDSFNHSTSPQMTGTGGADIFYTGGGNDTVDAGSGNDIVYGIDLNGDNSAAASSTKTINLGIGDDKYYGSNGKDIIDCGLGSDHVEAGAGENFIDLGTDNDKDTVIINNNASGVDTIANITKYDHISCVGGFNLSSLQQVGNDMIIYGNNGNKIIFKDVAGTESMPILEQEDNTLLYWKNGAYTEIEANPYAFENPSEEQICALLSKLAYENLSTGFNFNNLDKTKYTVAEIAYLKENFSVNEVKRNSASGFYGYVIENTQTGNFYYSIRGTDKLPGEAGAKDWGISTYGMAIDQFIEAYNFYVETLTPSGITGYKIITANKRPEDVDPCILDPDNGKCYYLRKFTGSNSDITSSTTITLTGTSLGGHLAGLLSTFIGKTSIIFNAPKYSYSSDKSLNFFTNQHAAPFSPYTAFEILLDDISQKSSLTHIYNDTYFENNTSWGEQKTISDVSDYTYVLQALDQINNTYYIYNTIKGIINDQEILDPDNDVDLKTAFDAVYHAYCVSENKSLKMLSHDNAIKNKECADEIAIWRQQRIDSNIIVDILPDDYPWSDVINGTEGNDLVFQKRRETASIDTDAGNDTVYAVGLDGTNANNAKAYLGAGSDIFYGSGGSDNVDGGYTKDAITDTNIIYLGGGNDIYSGGDGNDILIGGAGNDHLVGGNGADTYYFEAGFGNDTIDNSDDNASATAPDVIEFGEGILPSKTVLQRQGFDLIIKVSYEDTTLPADTVRVYSYFDQQGTTSATVNAIKFADGTSWDYEYVLTWNSADSAGGGKTYGLLSSCNFLDVSFSALKLRFSFSQFFSLILSCIFYNQKFVRN